MRIEYAMPLLLPLFIRYVMRDKLESYSYVPLDRNFISLRILSVLLIAFYFKFYIIIQLRICNVFFGLVKYGKEAL